MPSSLFGSLDDNGDGSYAASLDGEAISVPGAYELSITRQNEHVQVRLVPLFLWLGDFG